MGNFYVNFSVKGVAQTELIEDFRRNAIDAFVGPDERGWCCFAEEVTDSQDQSAITALGSSLSLRTGQPVLSVLNHDDDMLSVDLFVAGETVGDYNSCPGYFDDDPDPERLMPRLLHAEEFAKLREGLTVSNLRDALTTDQSLDAISSHERVVEQLALPGYSIGFGFGYASRGELPGEGSFVRTG
ncbi:hypothetical protein ACSBOB_12765 [Mesorhizobium sp. ASY16-5R]|uniref:hypothetical protein n=1 Tax=Mesorhizobium sp. ASY16-5R TaxID=3445772 RepID=UPI003FA181EE